MSVVLYLFCTALQEKVIFTDIFVSKFVFCLVRAVIYYYNYLPPQWVAIPPPCLRNHREYHANQTRQINSWRSERVGGFGAFLLLFFLSLLLWKYKRKRENILLIRRFCVCFDYILFMCCCVLVSIVLYFIFYNVWRRGGVVIFWGVFYFRFFIFYIFF